MATKKASAKKSTSGRTTVAATKTTAKKPAATKAAAKVVKPARVAELKVVKKEQLFPLNLPNIILAELVGTFVLTMVALTAFAVSPYVAAQAKVLSNWVIDPLFIGLTLTVLVMGVGLVSGAHVNPAVTFGLWAARKLKTVMVPVYWASQFLGALLAVGIMNVMTHGHFSVSLGSFTQFSLPLFFIELIGAAIFLFGIMSVVSREDMSTGSKALGVGMSLTIALIAGVGMLSMVQGVDAKKYTESLKNASVTSMDDIKKVPAERSLYVTSPVLNPAVALVAGESAATVNTIASTAFSANVDLTKDSEPSRFGLEVIVGNLIGAALGANLYLLIAYRPKDEA